MRVRRPEPRDAAFRVLAFAAILVAITASCSVASNVASVGNEEDGGFQGPFDSGMGGSSGSSSGGSSGAGSSGSSSGAQGGDAGAVFTFPTSILAVHASANLYDFRLCFGVAGSGQVFPFPAYPDDPAHPMPETNYPGVPVGGAVLLPTITLPSAPITVYVIPAYYLQSQGYVAGNEPTCDDLISKDLQPQNVEFFTIPDVGLPVGGGAVVLAIEGCAAGTGVAAGSVAQCGASFSAGTPNLSALAGALVPADDAGAWTMQVAQLSPSFSAGAGTAAALAYVDPTIDASVSLEAPESSISASSVMVPLSEAGVTSAYFVIGPSSSAPLAESLASIEYFQSPSSNPFTYFSSSSAYFVAIVGDATDAAAPASLPDGATNPAFDGHGLHVIAYPEN